MSADEIRELWSRFLAGEDLLLDDQRRLVEALDADPELRASLVENLQLDGALRAMAVTREQGDAFVRNLADCLGPERDATRFIQKVELSLQEPDPPPPSGTARRGKRPTTRRFRRPGAAPARETDWRPALIAAAAFIAILLVVTDSGSKPKPQPKPVAIVSPPKLESPPDPSPSPVEPRTPRSEDVLPSPKPLPLIPRAPDSKVEVPPPFPSPEPRPRVEPPAPPKEKPAATPSTKVDAPVIVDLHLEKADGNVFVSPRPAVKVRPRKNEPVAPGTVVDTLDASLAYLTLADGTWIELASNSSFREDPTPPAGQRRFVLSSGSLSSHIAKQSPDRPIVFATPNAEAKIVGTTVRLTVAHDRNGTTLEVKQGAVVFTRNDGKVIEVRTGQQAFAALGAPLELMKPFPDEFTIRFGPADALLLPGQLIDSGEEFDAARGYGWKGPKVGDLIPNLFWRDGNGVLQQKRKGRGDNRRLPLPGVSVDPMKLTDVSGGWAGLTETWILPIPNGKYLVSVCCGDASFEQGPHHVWIEGVQVIDQELNRPGKFIEKDALIEVKDGELTMKIGGNPGPKVSGDKSTDTLINYLTIKRVRK